MGLLAGWAIWSKYKAQVEEQAKEISSLRNRISTLENELEDCKRGRIEAKGRIAELETELSAALKAAAEAEASAGLAVGIADGDDASTDADEIDGGDDDAGEVSGSESNLGAVASGFAAGAVGGGGFDTRTGEPHGIGSIGPVVAAVAACRMAAFNQNRPDAQLQHPLRRSEHAFRFQLGHAAMMPERATFLETRRTLKSCDANHFK